MNRVIWRLIKFLITAVIVGLCVNQLSVINSRVDLDLPFPMNNNKRPKITFTDNKFHHHEKDGISKDKISSSFATQKSTSSAAYTDNILLRKPQQFNDYHHNGNGNFWPNKSDPYNDRILSQMIYSSDSEELKTILVYNGLTDGMKEGQGSLKALKCPVDKCYLTSSRDKASSAHLILWKEHLSRPSGRRPPGQIWMLFMLESPYHTTSLVTWKNQLNWTSTYRADSTIVAPYERFTYFNASIIQLPLKKNYAAGKSKKVAWFVSNCGARNNRLGYATELAKYINVDIYGACGTLSCPRRTADSCFDMLTTTYKFYLAFENSNCKDYITEKFFVNGLKNDVIPIVMGASPEDYKRAAPYHSYIHVDDFESPEELAKYLHQLDKDDAKYNEYFRWKGTGDNLNTYFWCRLCAMTHAASKSSVSHVYADPEDWWRGAGVCQELGNQLWPKW